MVFDSKSFKTHDCYSSSSRTYSDSFALAAYSTATLHFTTNLRKCSSGLVVAFGSSSTTTIEVPAAKEGIAIAVESNSKNAEVVG